MPLPILLAVLYLAINLAVMVWVEHERANGRAPTDRVTVIAAALRYGPPLIGLIYLVTIAGDWLFFGFVIVFFAAAFWMLNGLLAFNVPLRRHEPMKGGWDDRRSTGDRDRAT